MTTAHTIRYSIQDGLKPFLEKQCVNLQATGSVEYDYAKAESYIIDRYLAGIPALDLEVNAQAAHAYTILRCC
jgi:hypothetical protein